LGYWASPQRPVNANQDVGYGGDGEEVVEEKGSEKGVRVSLLGW
jgi:hypothetical protein